MKRFFCVWTDRTKCSRDESFAINWCRKIYGSNSAFEARDAHHDQLCLRRTLSARSYVFPRWKRLPHRRSESCHSFRENTCLQRAENILHSSGRNGDGDGKKRTRSARAQKKFFSKEFQFQNANFFTVSLQSSNFRVLMIPFFFHAEKRFFSP